MKCIRFLSLANAFACGTALFIVNGELYGQQQQQQPKPPQNVPAQQKAAPAANVINIRTITDLNREYRVKAPMYVNTSARNDRDWGVFDVMFDVQNTDWIDSLTVDFTVLLENKKAKPDEKPMSLYKVSTVYPDVMMGRSRKVGVVLSPAALLRYGEPIGFVAQFSVGGRVVAVKDVSVGAAKSVEKWWENPMVVDSQKLAKRSGHLQERSKSVFALLDIDSYEVAQ